MSSKIKNFLPTTLHTFKKKITNPFSGKNVREVTPITLDNTLNILHNYDSYFVNKDKIGKSSKVNNKFFERKYPTIP
jgi:hypothetical protein